MKALALASVALVGLTVVLAAVALVGRGSAESSQGDGPFRGSEAIPGFELSTFVLRDHLGRTLRSTELADRVTLLTFLDSQCAESCPVIAAALARGIDSLTVAEREQVVAVAISTDPSEDTRASVDRFLQARHAAGRIRYLTQPTVDLERLWKEFQILPSLETGNDSLHSAPVRIYGRDGTWLATLHAGADLTHANLLHDIRAALATWQRESCSDGRPAGLRDRGESD